MKNVKKALTFLADVIEVYIPMILFSIMFVMFVVQIVYRYLFNMQMAWQNEIIVICFSWTMIFSASYGTRTDTHVAFSSVYDAVSEKTKWFFRVAVNLIQVAVILLIFKPTWTTVMFYKMVKTPILKFPMNYYYFPFIIFISLTLIHSIVLFGKDLSAFRSVFLKEKEV